MFLRENSRFFSFSVPSKRSKATQTTKPRRRENSEQVEHIDKCYKLKSSSNIHKQKRLLRRTWQLTGCSAAMPTHSFDTNIFIHYVVLMTE